MAADPATTPPLRILLVADSAFQAELIKRVLARSRTARFTVAHAAGLAEATGLLVGERFDLLLADLVLPDSQGVGTVRRLASCARGLPIVVLTRLDDEELGIEAVQAGAQDYLIKDRSVEAILVRTLRHALERHRLRVALEEAQREAQHLATHDRLTGLPNRFLLQDRLHEALRYAQRHGQELAVLFVDLDGFKAINDTQGHARGDEALCWLASRLTGCVRRSDTVARFAGDEFVIVQRDLRGERDAVRLAERILAATAPGPFSGDRLPLGLSIGVAVFPRDGADADALLRAADAAMYQAKGRGGSGYTVAGEAPPLPLPLLARRSR